MQDLTNDEKRIKILEHLGWRELTHEGKMSWVALRGVDPIGRINQSAPNPFTNLNFIHKIEKTLDHKQWLEYTDILWRNSLKKEEVRQDVCASAEERANAIGLTLKLWDDS